MATGVAAPIAFQADGAALDVEEEDDDAWKPDSLALRDALRFALTRDPRVQAALANVHVALAESRQARLLPNPVLDVAFRFPEGGGPLQVDMGLSADLLSLVRKPREISAADHRLRAAAADAVVIALDVVMEVQDAYAAAQALDAESTVVSEQIALNARLLSLARNRLEAGESGRLDVLSIDAHRVELETDAIQRGVEASEKRLALARLIGRPSGKTDWKLETFSTPAKLEPDEAAWIAMALRRRPEAQSRRWELAALGDEAAPARLGVFDGFGIGIDAERDGGWSVGPALSAPIAIFDWGHARKEKALAQRVAARHRAVETQRQIVEDVRQAIQRLRATQAALQTVESELLPIQTQRYEQVEASYRAGLVDITTLIIAEQDLLTSRAKLIDLQRDAVLALARLHRAVGGAGAATSLDRLPTTLRTQP